MTSFVRSNVRVDCDEERKAQNSKKRPILAALTSIMLLLDIVGVSMGTQVTSSEVHDDPQGTKVLSNLVKSVCSQTRFPHRCVSSLASYRGFETASLDILISLALTESMEQTQHAYELSMSLDSDMMNERERAAWQDCVELFQDTLDSLNVCLSNNSVKKDIPNLLSAALTNQETCLNGFLDFNLTDSSNIKALMSSRAVNVSELTSNLLCMYKLSSFKNRRLLSSEREEELDSHYSLIERDGFPVWLSADDRRHLQSSRQAHVVVAKDGSGNYLTITEAVNAAPSKSKRRHIIYVKAGVYKENVDILKTKTNLMLIGDGKDRTILTGSKNVLDGSTTFKSATLAVSGTGFIARDMTFENTAGPQKHQAVALRVGADFSVVYRCSIKGYQDTLYVYSLRQFYREVDIYGTVDFIFGNAAVVIQNSNILVRRPMRQQKNTITAQGRTDPHQNTGISIHNCRVSPAPDLQPVKKSIQTYLGRPWKQYSRTVFMQSILDDLIDPAGWCEWKGSFALQTLYYGEYMNTGVGAVTSGRVRWHGFHVIKSATEAARFTVGQFIFGNLWIPAARVPFTLGLI